MKASKYSVAKVVGLLIRLARTKAKHSMKLSWLKMLAYMKLLSSGSLAASRAASFLQRCSNSMRHRLACQSSLSKAQMRSECCIMYQAASQASHSFEALCSPDSLPYRVTGSHSILLLMAALSRLFPFDVLQIATSHLLC